jgi:hypothetical protein
MIRVSWSQSKSRGPLVRPAVAALSSGNIANSAEGSLPFRCARILSISPVVRHSIFNAAVRRPDYDLDLPGAPLAGLNINPNAAQSNTRLSRCIQVIATWRSAGVLSSQLSPVG